MDITQEELIAALVRRLEGRAPYTRRRPARRSEDELELEVLIDLAASDRELVDLDKDGAELLDR